MTRILGSDAILRSLEEEGVEVMFGIPGGGILPTYDSIARGRELPATMKAAFHVARTGRPGPVLVDIAKDVQEAELNFSYPDEVDLPGWRPPSKVHERQVHEAAKAIAEARCPIIYAGGGVINAEASAELLAL